MKYDKNGRFLAQAGSEKAGNALGEFNLPHGLQVDLQGNVWVADRTNNRYQVLDNNLKPIREITNLGVGWTVCVSGGPHQYAFLSNSNPNGNMPGRGTSPAKSTRRNSTARCSASSGTPARWPLDSRWFT